MALENEKLEIDQVGDAGKSDRGSERAPEHHEPRESREPAKDPKSLRNLVRGAVAEQKQVEAKRDPSPARQAAAEQRTREQATGKFASTTSDSRPNAGAPDARSPAASTSSPAASTDGTAAAATPQASAAVAAPAALSKEVKAIWDTLPAPVQAEFAKREADTRKGVEQLQARYQPIDEALAPYRSAIQQHGRTEAQAIKQLFDWHAALGGQHKVTAFKALAAAHGVDISTLASPSGGAASNPQSQTQSQEPDFARHVEPVHREVQAVRGELDSMKRERVNSEITSFSKDKPHFEKVRVLMAQLMGSGAATSLEDAYARACRADPEVFETIQQEAQAKRQSDAKAAAAEQQRKQVEAETERKRLEAEQVAKARKAGVGPRAGSPAGAAMQVAKAAQGKPVRDSIREAMKDRSAAI